MVNQYRVTSKETIKPCLRGMPMLIVVGSCAVFVWIVMSQRAELRLIFVAGFVILAIWGLARFSKEHAIVSNIASSIGTVVELDKERSSDGGYNYAAKYQFTADDGNVYFANSGGTIKEIPGEGSPIQIMYNKNDPKRNLPRELFWFYRI